MKSWTIILSLVFWAQTTYACNFKKSYSSIYSLSGSMTVAIRELGLLSKLAGISVFNPISRNEFKGEFLPGGVFLSRELAQKMKGSLVFFDDSRELSKMFSSMQVEKVEIKTRGQLPLETVEFLTVKLKAYTEGCEGAIKKFKEKAQNLSLEILKSMPKDFHAVFFLGAIRQGRPPELLIGEDGIVKWLKLEGKLKTYPSALAYISWSPKIMQGLSSKTIKIGVIDSAGQFVKNIQRQTASVMNFTYPGNLVPGFSQLEAWHYLFKEWDHENPNK